MAGNNEKKAQVKEKTTASIEFTDVDGRDSNGSYALRISPDAVHSTNSTTTINVTIGYYSEGKTAQADDEYIGQYEIKAMIKGLITFDTKDFISAIKTGKKRLLDMKNFSYKTEEVEITELNPISTNRSSSVSLEQVKSALKYKFMNNITIDTFQDAELVITVITQDYDINS